MRARFLALALAVAPVTIASQGPLYESFEEGFGAWERDADVWCWHAPEPCEWDPLIERVPGAAFDGAWGLLFLAEGVHDDGTFWLERELPTPPGERVEIAFWVLMPRLSPYAHWQVKAYLGEEDPELQEQFATLGDTDVVPGWNRFCLSVPAPEAETLWAAFGLRVSFEETRAFALDHVSLRGAADAEPCGLLEDPCHVVGAVCRAQSAACALMACQMRP